VPVPDSATLRLGTDPSAVSARLPFAAPPLDGVNVTLKVRLWPGFSVVGTFNPLVPKPAPVTAAVAMCKTDPPEFVRRSVCDCVLPTCTLPNPTLDGLAAMVGAVTPVPDSPTFSEGFDAVLVMATLPVTAPAALGVKVAVKLVLSPAPSVSGVETPLKLKPVPLADICEIVTPELALFVSVIVCAWLFPNWTLPNATLAGFAPSDPAASPDPVRARFTVAMLLANATPPLALPAACGANVTVNPELCPGVSVKGVASPLTVKPVPVAVAVVIVTAMPPAFVMVTGWL
jgi:hypothetical protein